MSIFAREKKPFDKNKLKSILFSLFMVAFFCGIVIYAIRTTWHQNSGSINALLQFKAKLEEPVDQNDIIRTSVVNTSDRTDLIQILQNANIDLYTGDEFDTDKYENLSLQLSTNLCITYRQLAVLLSDINGLNYMEISSYKTDENVYIYSVICVDLTDANIGINYLYLRSTNMVQNDLILSATDVHINNLDDQTNSSLINALNTSPSSITNIFKYTIDELTTTLSSKLNATISFDENGMNISM